MRFAIVRNARDARHLEAYLPPGYRVIGDTGDGFLIAGEDRHGWTLDGYVIPRLASGLVWATELVERFEGQGVDLGAVERLERMGDPEYDSRANYPERYTEGPI